MELYPPLCKKREPCSEFDGKEDGLDFRTEFRKDYGRLLHSAAFRRLQGKTQLFPGLESDFFRNRLTHSLEVGQIAKGLAIHLNATCPELAGEGNQIDYDLVEFASLAHDLGHPPFGHSGESELHEIMSSNYGYEGNAQTLRILSRLEKRYRYSTLHHTPVDRKADHRAGLNLTYRSLASILKYDNAIPKRSNQDRPVKGYYQYDKDLVDKIKFYVTGKKAFNDDFKTLECHLMDLADDIAYSTYDFEDSLKAGFLHLLDIFNPNKELLKEVAIKVEENVIKVKIKKQYTPEQILNIYIYTICSVINKLELQDVHLPNKKEPYIVQAGKLYDQLKKIGDDGYLRTNLTSKLVHRFINGVKLEYNKSIPALSRVYLAEEIREEVEVLKNLVYVSQIDSPKIKLSSYRGREIVRTIFDAIHLTPNGKKLLPDDFRHMYNALPNKNPYRARIVTDFIAGMTDRYAIEFYGRLKSENPQTIFKPL